jgi:catechol 2,3-dioxygenase-like lactoylglutathione lyase family enzyme
VIVIPVSDVERAKKFYEGLGWRLDADFKRGDEWRVVQFTPPGSQCSIHFGKGLTPAVPGSVKGLYLVVTDLEAARTDLQAHGADVSEVFHFEGDLNVSGTKGRAAGPDPQGRSYFSYASFSDPDGNGWLLQEIKARLPGRGFSADVEALTELLREAEQHHGAYEAKAPKHHWSGWYAAFILARERGKTTEEAIKEAGRHMESASRPA